MTLGLREHEAMVEFCRMHGLQADACVRAAVQQGMLEGCWAAKVGQERRVDVEAAVGGGVQDAGWDEEAEGDGYYEIWRVSGGWRPGSESVDLVDREGEGGCDGFDGDWLRGGVSGGVGEE